MIAVVGPSGVGKDSVIAGIAAARPDLIRVRRAITRPPSGTEPFESVTEAEFARRRGAGGFCLDWRAHGLSYGIPVAAERAVLAGGTAVANLSRGVLGRAAARMPLRVLRVAARPETLAARLRGRGREGGAEIAARLSRGASLPPGLDVTEVDNDGALEDAVAAALAALPQPVRG